MTQEQLAERADVDLRSLQRIEAGSWNMTIDYLDRFRRALGCTWRQMVMRMDNGGMTEVSVSGRSDAAA